MSKNLYVGNLARRTINSDLEDVFGSYGKIVDARVIKEKRYGFVEFENADDAKEALTKLDGYTLGNNKIKVEYANKKTPSKDTCFNCNEEGHW